MTTPQSPTSSEAKKLLRGINTAPCNEYDLKQSVASLADVLNDVLNILYNLHPGTEGGGGEGTTGGNNGGSGGGGGGGEDTDPFGFLSWGWARATANAAFTEASPSFIGTLTELHFVVDKSVGNPVTIHNYGIFEGEIGDNCLIVRRSDGDFELFQKNCPETV